MNLLPGLDSHLQYELAARAADKNWNVRKMELEVKKLQQPTSAKDNLYSDSNIKQLESSLSEHVGNRVEIDYEDQGGGYVRIRFNNIDELEGHFDRIGFEYEKSV